MLRYRLSDVTDPEERLEDAALWKALNDVLGDRVGLYDDGPDAPASAAVLHDDDILVGRRRRNEHSWPTQELTPSFLPYWTDPTFLAASGRFFELHDYEGAMTTCNRLHAEGKGAFLKSVRTKHYTQAVPLGSDPRDLVGEMAYSFIDHGPCLMVQELVPMTCETRFAVMGGVVVASSPVAHWLTPLDTARVVDHVSPTPRSGELVRDPEAVELLSEFAASVAATLRDQDCILDCCLTTGSRPIAIELNALSIGAFGLYAMDVHALAKGVRDILLPRHQAGDRATISL